VPGACGGACPGTWKKFGGDVDAVQPVVFDFDCKGREGCAKNVGIEAGPIAPAVCSTMSEYDAVEGLVDGGVGRGIVWDERRL
jgi:hypothetical protein